jgi:hypothetical protein
VAVEPKVDGGTKRTSETVRSTSERTLLYFIDMALLEAREALAAAPGAKSCNDPEQPARSPR